MVDKVKLRPTIGGEIPYYDFTVKVPAAFTHLDLGKAMKLSADSEFALCVDGDEIEGQLIYIEDGELSGGKRVATMRSLAVGMFYAINGTATALAVGDEVVAFTQGAAGTPNAAAPYHVVMKVKKATTPTGDRLRVVAIESGNGGINSVVTVSKLFNKYVPAA